MKKLLIACIAVAMVVLVVKVAGAVEFFDLGFTANGAPLLQDGDSFTLSTNGEPDIDYELDFDLVTVTDTEFYREGLFIETTESTRTTLKDYYETKALPEEWLTYYKNAVDGVVPFAFLQTGAVNSDGMYSISLLDGAYQSLFFSFFLVPMVIPGDYPCGTYTMITEDESVAFTLQIQGDHCPDFVADILDSDQDGIADAEDQCPDTIYDRPTVRHGTNRWIWNGGTWETVHPKEKGPKKVFTMEQTGGCSCEQILDILKRDTGSEYEGHYKFGCTAGMLEQWSMQ